MRYTSGAHSLGEDLRRRNIDQRRPNSPQDYITPEMTSSGTTQMMKS